MDLQQQLQEDLFGVLLVLREFQRVDRDRTALVALGRSAGWALPCVGDGGWPPVAVVAPAPEGAALPEQTHAVDLPEDVEVEPWLDEVGTYLKGALGSDGG
jgi:hypothetical protein